MLPLMHKKNQAFEAISCKYRVFTRLLTTSLAFGLASGISACAAPTNPKALVLPPANGLWQVNSQRCDLSAVLPEIHISTDGRVGSDGRMALRLVFVPSLLRPPVAEVSGLAMPLLVEGPGALAPFTGRANTVQLPYHAGTAAQLLQDNTFLTVTYQPIGQTAPRSGYVRTRAMILGLAELDKVCPE